MPNVQVQSHFSFETHMHICTYNRLASPLLTMVPLRLHREMAVDCLQVNG